MFRGKPLDEFKDWRIAAGESDEERRSKFKQGHSQYELAYSWAEAKGIPPEVRKVFDESDYEILRGIRFCEGWVEDPIPLPGPEYPKKRPTNSPYDRGCNTFNDISVLCDSDFGNVAIAVEGKVGEPFGKTVGDWLGKSRVTCCWQGRKRNWRCCRLQEAKEFLGLSKLSPSVRIQLLYRAIGALGFAEQKGAESAVLLVHSFSEQDESLQDFEDFIRLFDAECDVNEAVFVGRIQGIDLYAAWVKGEQSSGGS